MPFLLTVAVTIIALFSSPVAAVEGQADVRDLVGARIVTSAEGDFSGPSREVIAGLYEKSQATCTRITIRWGDIEKQDPGNGSSSYDWVSFDSDPMMKFSRTRIISIDLANSWADKLKTQDPDRYWQLAERFTKELVKRSVERGVSYFHITGRHYNRLNRTDWPQLVVEPLKRLYPVIKSVKEDSVVIGGNIYGGNVEDVQALYWAGIKGYFDVLEIHPYTDIPEFGVDISQITAARSVMERNGDGRKQIFIGEGWGPENCTAEDIDVLRSYLVNGLRNLRASKSDYEPAWVLGALFNSFNDYRLNTSLKDKVEKVDEDGDGKIDCILVDGYRLAPDADLEKADFNGGLIDIDGNPKNGLMDLFGQNMQIELTGTFVNIGPSAALLPGTSQKLTVEAYNVMDEPIDSPHIDLRANHPAVVIKDEGNPLPTKLNGTTRVKRDFTITVPAESAESDVSLTCKLFFKWRGGDYCIDTVIPVNVNNPVDVTVLPNRVVLPETKQLGVSVINHTKEDLKANLTFELPEGMRLLPLETTVEVGAMGLEAKVFDTAIAPGLKVGRSRAKLFINGKQSGGFDVDVPATAAKLSVKADGVLSEWNVAPIQFGSDPKASVRFAYDSNAFYIAVEADDEVHMQPYTGLEVWRGDSVRVAIDPLLDGPFTQSGGYNSDDHEFVFAIGSTGPTAMRLFGTTGSSTLTGSGLKLDGKKAVYEIAIPWSELAPLKPEAGKVFGISVLVNDIGSGLKQSQWGGGIAGKKDPREFYTVKLAE